ncbi:GlsB/YeaQ/YmgE family stress response membrane protein [bacterium]|jgi:uncharacterized membrane protein YeaQ/YmgE (transglycosylase-associated protein family)|nr:GlsB/YeaQ/YmgE family stress response membrane protein [bacterium]
MFNLVIWAVYGLFVGSIAKSIVPGEENFGFWKTVALGVAGSYSGGIITYLLGMTPLQPAGVVMGVVGAVTSLVLYKKLLEK